MPPEKSRAKEIQELQEKLARQRDLLKEKDKTIRKLQDAEKAREFEAEKRIPIPQGQAGRGEGYNLFDEMGVSKATFQAIRNVIRHKTSQFLDVTKTIRRQDLTRLNHTLFQISKSLPFIEKYYESSWPIRPIMRQYLANTHRAHKKAVKYLKNIKEVPIHFGKAKSATMAQKITGKRKNKPEKNQKTTDNANPTDDESGSDNSADDSDYSSDDDEEEEMPTYVSKKLATAEGSARTGNNAGDTADEDAHTSSEGEIARSAANRGAGATRERHETASTEGNPCGDATSNGLQDEARLRQPAKKSDNLSMIAVPQTRIYKGKFPAVCSICDEKFPENPSEKVMNLYEAIQLAQRDSTVERHQDGTPKGVNFLRLQLCVAIQADVDYENNYSLAELNHWPAPGLDFERVYKRILDLDEHGTIWGFLSNDIVLRSSLAWKSFSARIMDTTYTKPGDSCKSSYSLHQFLSLPFPRKLGLLKTLHFAGYYGPAGEEVILSTLRYHIFPLFKNSLAVLAATLTDVFEAEQCLAEKVGFWKGFQPMAFTLDDFMHFIAGPFVANLLICGDYGVSEAEAEVTRIESMEYGKAIHPTNDSIDDLVMTIAAPQRQLSPFVDNVQQDNFSAPAARSGEAIQAVPSRWVAHTQNMIPLNPVNETHAPSSTTVEKRTRNAEDENSSLPMMPVKKQKRNNIPIKSVQDNLPLRRSTRRKTVKS